jgi:hypothetical protein
MRFWQPGPSCCISSCPTAEVYLAPLRALVNLHSLDISNCTKVTDVAPLGALLSLQSLTMNVCPEVRDLAPLGALLSLQSLNTDGYCLPWSPDEPAEPQHELRRHA